MTLKIPFLKDENSANTVTCGYFIYQKMFDSVKCKMLKENVKGKLLLLYAY